jgi:mannose-1-phosphate guanylyltransferase
MTEALDFQPIILAGGSGTRFWPRSRKARAKQVLALDGERTMIQNTLDRLAPLAGADKTWVITNDLLAPTIAAQLPAMPIQHILCEPAARNTAPAAGLAAFILEKISPAAILGIFPADHVIGNESAFISVLRKGITLAATPGRIVVIGIQPTRAEVGYGYIETGSDAGPNVVRVCRFTEKPDRAHAEKFVASGNYYWNSGIFLWSASTLANAIREHLPKTAPLLQKIADAFGTPAFNAVFAEQYPQCENISIDYAVLEPRSAKGEQASNIYCLPAEFGWNDLGSWAALFEHKAQAMEYSESSAENLPNIAETADTLSIESTGNYVYSPDKFVALVGVEGLVVVDTGDALLITTRERSQDVGKIVKELAAAGKTSLI